MLCCGCTERNDIGAKEFQINPAYIEISADACNLEYKMEDENLLALPLYHVRETEYTADWNKKKWFDCGGKSWGEVDYSDSKANYNDSYSGICCNPDNPSELIVTGGELRGKSVSVQIPKNTTSKKRCFYLYFDDMFAAYAMACILQHEK